MLHVELDHQALVYRPGTTLSGRILWEMSHAPDAIYASLSWSTEGKGDEDSDSVINQRWQPTTESGSQSFKWQMPRGPLSFDGKLIRIRWTLECYSEKPDEEFSIPIVLSHLTTPITGHRPFDNLR